MGPLGDVLGPSWGVLECPGASWGVLGASWREKYGKRQASGPSGAKKKTCRWQRTGSALKRKPNARPWGTSRTIDVLKKSFEKSLGIILETSCAIGNTYSELRRFAAHSRERECPHANASWNVSRRPKIPPRAPKTPQPPPNATKTPHLLSGTRTASYAASRLTRASVSVLMLIRLGAFQDVPRYPQRPP